MGIIVFVRDNSWFLKIIKIFCMVLLILFVEVIWFMFCFILNNFGLNFLLDFFLLFEDLFLFELIFLSLFLKIIKYFINDIFICILRENLILEF